MIDLGPGAATVPVEGAPKAIAVDEAIEPHQVYAANTNSDTVSVIDEPAARRAGRRGRSRRTSDAAGPTLTTIDPFPSDRASAGAVLTGTASDLRSPYVSAIRAVYYRLDGESAWTSATITGGAGTPEVTWSATPRVALSDGPHAVEAVAVDDRATAVSTSDLGSGFVAPPMGTQTSYAFEVGTVADDAAPAVSAAALVPPSPVPGRPVRIAAVADDSASGGSRIASGAYSMDEGPWLPMAAADGALDAPVESLIATVGPFATTGLHTLAVRSADAAGNTSAGARSTFAVVDPRGGSLGVDVRFTPPGSAARPRLRADARYLMGGALSAHVRFSAPGVSFEATSGEWLLVQGNAAVLSAQGRLASGTRAVGTVWAIDRRNARRSVVRVRIATVTGETLYDSQPGAPLTALPAGSVRSGAVRVRAGILPYPFPAALRR